MCYLCTDTTLAHGSELSAPPVSPTFPQMAKNSVLTLSPDGQPGRCTLKKAAAYLARGIAHQREDGTLIFRALDISTLPAGPGLMWPATLPATIERTPQHERTSDSGLSLSRYPLPCQHSTERWPALARQGAGL